MRLCGFTLASFGFFFPSSVFPFSFDLQEGPIEIPKIPNENPDGLSRWGNRKPAVAL